MQKSNNEERKAGIRHYIQRLISNGTTFPPYNSSEELLTIFHERILPQAIKNLSGRDGFRLSDSALMEKSKLVFMVAYLECVPDRKTSPIHKDIELDTKEADKKQSIFKAMVLGNNIWKTNLENRILSGQPIEFYTKNDLAEMLKAFDQETNDKDVLSIRDDCLKFLQIGDMASFGVGMSHLGYQTALDKARIHEKLILDEIRQIINIKDPTKRVKELNKFGNLQLLKEWLPLHCEWIKDFYTGKKTAYNNQAIQPNSVPQLIKLVIYPALTHHKATQKIVGVKDSETLCQGEYRQIIEQNLTFL